MASQIDVPPQTRATRAESKADATTAAALEIIESEAAARIAKTERLKAARLAAPAPDAEPAKQKRAAKKKTVAR
ncbi:MAG: hypothetical protein KF849_07330 [Rhizobiaceae bacterium]|nr:hypothetical protein [Rhizobiaceae bacterium]